jgi:hypothetical protein
MSADCSLQVVEKSTSFWRSDFGERQHLAAVYVIVNSTTMWLAGRIHETVLPLIQQHPPTESSFQFLFSHLFLFIGIWQPAVCRQHPAGLRYYLLSTNYDSPVYPCLGRAPGACRTYELRSRKTKLERGGRQASPAQLH